METGHRFPPSFFYCRIILKISAGIIKKADVVIAMDDKVYSRAKNSLTRQFPNHAKKVHRFSELTMDHRVIKDPAGSGSEKLHKKIIGSIHSTLAKKYKDILAWAE